MQDTQYDDSFYRDYKKMTSTICPDCGHCLSMKVESPKNGTGSESDTCMGNVVEILWCRNCRKRPDV